MSFLQGFTVLKELPEKKKVRTSTWHFIIAEFLNTGNQMMGKEYSSERDVKSEYSKAYTVIKSGNYPVRLARRENMLILMRDDAKC